MTFIPIDSDFIIRCCEENFLHRVWRVKSVSWGRYGQILEVQNEVRAMEAKPSRIMIDYMIKVFDGKNVIFPTIRDTIKLLNTKDDIEIDIDGERKHLAEWAKDKQETIKLLKSLANWQGIANE